jgi:hypothetical protein
MTIQLPEIIGLPPEGYVSSNFKNSSIPVVEFTPGVPDFTKGLTLFSIKTSKTKTEYKNILAEYGYDVKLPLKLAFLADNFPTDTFANEYGSHFLEGMAGVVSEGAQALTQTFGGRTATGTLEKLSKELEDSGKIAGMIGGGIGKGVEGLRVVKERMGNVGEMMDKVAAGARVDFPQVWKGSSFQPSYTMTIRLFNPNPANDRTTDKYIIGPLAAILALALPQTTDDGTYNWPYFQKVVSKGLFILDPAVITNITVVKGGDQQQISFNQRLSIVDIRIDLVGLFQTLLMNTKGGGENTNRPTLWQYLNNLKQQRTIKNIYEPSGGYGTAEDEIQQQARAEGSGEEFSSTKGAVETPLEPANSPPEHRVSDSDRQKYESLQS